MPKYISDKVIKALAMYRTFKNLSVKEICEECKISISSLHKTRKKLGIEIRSKKHDKNHDVDRINKYIEDFRIQKNEKNVGETKKPKKPRKINITTTFEETLSEEDKRLLKLFNDEIKN